MVELVLELDIISIWLIIRTYNLIRWFNKTIKIDWKEELAIQNRASGVNCINDLGICDLTNGLVRNN
jgi:hypothetical protein